MPTPPATIAARFSKSWDEVARLTDAHTTVVQSWLPTRAPQAARFEGLGVMAGSSSIPISLLNLAIGCRYPPGASDETIDADIRSLKMFFAARRVPWYWLIGPYVHPPDIARRMERHGLRFDRPPLPAMTAPLPAQFPSLNSDVQVWQAASLEDLRAASAIRRIAFRFPNDVALDYFEAMADDWLRGDPARLYLARLGDGPPAAIGALIMGAGIPGVYVMATLHEWGRRGLAKAILARILSEATAERHTLIALTAGTRGYPLYRQFGFERVFDYHLYRPARDGSA